MYTIRTPYAITPFIHRACNIIHSLSAGLLQNGRGCSLQVKVKGGNGQGQERERRQTNVFIESAEARHYKHDGVQYVFKYQKSIVKPETLVRRHWNCMTCEEKQRDSKHTTITSLPWKWKHTRYLETRKAGGILPMKPSVWLV